MMAYTSEYGLGNTTMNSKFWEELVEEIEKREKAIEKEKNIESIREAVRREFELAHQSEAMETNPLTTP